MSDPDLTRLFAQLRTITGSDVDAEMLLGRLTNLAADLNDCDRADLMDAYITARSYGADLSDDDLRHLHRLATRNRKGLLETVNAVVAISRNRPLWAPLMTTGQLILKLLTKQPDN